MVTSSKSLVSITGRMPWLVGIFLMFAFPVCAQPSSLRSPDGKYEATLAVKGPGEVHYQVKEVETGRIVLTTTAQYPTANDVKDGMVSPDSKEFVAVYHYGHGGPHSWIRIWDLETCKRVPPDTKCEPVRSERKDGWIRDVSFIFKK